MGVTLWPATPDKIVEKELIGEKLKESILYFFGSSHEAFVFEPVVEPNDRLRLGNDRKAVRPPAILVEIGVHTASGEPNRCTEYIRCHDARIRANLVFCRTDKWYFDSAPRRSQRCYEEHASSAGVEANELRVFRGVSQAHGTLKSWMLCIVIDRKGSHDILQSL